MKFKLENFTFLSFAKKLKFMSSKFLYPGIFNFAFFTEPDIK